VLLIVGVQSAQAGINVWTGSTCAYPYPCFDYFFDYLVVATGKPSALYASRYSAEDGWVYKSTDGGSTWDQILDAGNPAAVMAAEPSTPNSVYVQTVAYGESGQLIAHVLRSTDGGATWSQVDTGLGRDTNAVSKILALAIDPHTPTTLYAGTDLGLFKSTDAASTWSILNTGLSSDATGRRLCRRL